MNLYKRTNRRQRLSTALILLIVTLIGLAYTPQGQEVLSDNDTTNLTAPAASDAGKALSKLPIKGRAPKTGYERAQFGADWNSTMTCDVRNEILKRDLTDEVVDVDGCTVLSGKLNDPYTGKTINFIRGKNTSSRVQIDHVVALSDAWQKGAQQLDYVKKNSFANDPLNLLAVDGGANQQKGDSDAASWLPPNKSFRCSYVSRQIAVKQKYSLWITRAEYEAINKILLTCSGQTLPVN